jgi:two-component sensor histidine kinase
MKNAPVIKKIIYSSAFLAGIPAILILLFLHPLRSKYILTVGQDGVHSGQYLYEDLNADSVSELVYSGKGLPYYFIALRNYDFKFYDQWNISDSLSPAISEIFFGDYNHNLKKEIYVFSYKGDSLFLNMNEMINPHGPRMERIFITKIGYLKGEVTSSLYPIGFYDANGDGKDEIYFGITTGFEADPRRVYSYDLVHRKLESSQFTGIISLNPKMTDVDGDGKPEIFGSISACGNFGRMVPYSDSSTWFMVFNTNLRFEFPPVEFYGYVNSLETEAYKNGSFNGYVLSHVVNGMDTTIMDGRIIICSSDSKSARYRLYKEIGLSGIIRMYVVKSDNSDKIYLLKDKFIELNEKLETVRTVPIPFNSPVTAWQFDLTGNGDPDFLLYSDSEQKLAVFNSSLQKLAEIKFKTGQANWRFSHMYSENHTHKVYLSVGNEGYILNLKRNSLSFIGYLAYPGIYLLFLVFIVLIKRINTLQVVQKESLNRRLVTLQLQGIKSQLDPHFTFNTLNSIASLIYLEDRQLAYDYMNKFTHLLRGLINDAERIYRSLGEELEFVTTYLELEKLRFGDRFTYEIVMGENVSMSEQVPKLVLHTFAENAIKHGIMGRNEGGNLKIRAERDNDYLVLSVEDNGVGRERTEGQSTSTGKGLKLTDEFYDILNQLNRKPIRHLIIDLHNDNGEPTGTRVEVWVPIE